MESYVCALKFYDSYVYKMNPDERTSFENVFKKHNCPAYMLSSKNRGHKDSCETEH